MSKIDLQAEIKAIQEFGKEAETLINKMNASAEKVNEASNLEVQRIKNRLSEIWTNCLFIYQKELILMCPELLKKIRMDILWNGLRLYLDTPATA